MTGDDHILLDVHNLEVSFFSRGRWVRVVDDVSLRVPRGRTVALVGESGCGKSATALSILRLIPSPPGRIAGGKILFASHPGMAPPIKGDATGGYPPPDVIDLLQLDDRALRRIRGNRIAMIFQEPMSALNPVYSVGEQIVEGIQLHQRVTGRAAWRAAVEMLRQVGIADPKRSSRAYPHELSGGMRQRVMIAMALACRPALLIADEPTTALDVTVQQQILDLLRSLQGQTGLSILLITHDLDVVAGFADEVYVMYAGRIVERGPVAEVLGQPLHPYTQGLLECTPRLPPRSGRLPVIGGSVPDPADFPSGCRFHPRCPLSVARAGEDRAVKSDGKRVVLRRCVEAYDEEPSGVPELRELRPAHFAACWEAEATPVGCTAAGLPVS